MTSYSRQRCGNAVMIGPSADPSIFRPGAILRLFVIVGGIAITSVLTPVANASAWACPERDASLGAESRPCEIQIDPATPRSLGIRWPVLGDNNNNATVNVRYRRVGAGEWKPARSLFRPSVDRLSDRLRVEGGALFAGSIVNLRPATSYRVRLELNDPDGGADTRELTLRTTGEPVAPKTMRARYVMPASGPNAPIGSGTIGDPYRGLSTAIERAMPGDILLLQKGHYSVGKLELKRSGLPGRPIVFSGPPEGEAVLDGGGASALFDVSGLRHVWFERLTFRNADVLIQARWASHIVVRHNRFLIQNRKLAAGIEAKDATDRESVGFFITDNVFTGPNVWPDGHSRKSSPDFVFAIVVTGSGHVVSHNLIRNVGDGINNGNGGRLSASDIHNNEVINATDDCIEADHSEANLRVYRNRLTNCFAGVSVQPSHGGPVYIFRNLILNTQYSPFKLHNHTAGVLLFHNTSVRAGIPFLIQPGRETVNDVVTRNNLFVGTRGPALRSTGRMIRSDFDSDGYSWRNGGFALWNGQFIRSPSAARRSGALYHRKGAIALDGTSLFATGLGPPGNPNLPSTAESNDPRLAAGSAAVDSGARLANFNADFLGRGPDLGCCELGRPLPHFGPRPPAGRR